jgi:hypothetical protein
MLLVAFEDYGGDDNFPRNQQLAEPDYGDGSPISENDCSSEVSVDKGKRKPVVGS